MMNSSSTPSFRRHALSALFAATVVAAAGCAQVGTSQPEGASAPAPAAAPAGPKTGPGMNAQGQVVDSKLVEAGHGQKVKGLGDWEGEITGKPAPGSKFTRLQIGMSMKQVADIMGAPSDQGSYVNSKAWIPFYFGADRHRHELVYKNQGRLIFAGGGGWMPAGGEGNLIWIIHNAGEAGTR